MACAPISSGSEFLASLLAHVDCQAQTLGSIGYQSFNAPGSMAAIMLTGLLTLFIALWGFRLMFGEAPTSSDGFAILIKLGIVLTLATSWPAYRILLYDVVLRGPAELAAAMHGADRSGVPLVQRLQTIDNEIVALTIAGSGRADARAVAVPTGMTPADAFKANTLSDDLALGAARIFFLAGVIAPVVAIRLAAGILLALTPLAAGLLLFGFTKGLFAGWVRGLVAALLGAIAFAVLLDVELAVLEPWFANVLAQRQADIAIPSAPSELLAMTLSFNLATAALLLLIWKASFHPSIDQMLTVVHKGPSQDETARFSSASHEWGRHEHTSPERAMMIAQGLALSRDAAPADTLPRAKTVSEALEHRTLEPAIATDVPRLGQTYRRVITMKPRSGSGRGSR